MQQAIASDQGSKRRPPWALPPDNYLIQRPEFAQIHLASSLPGPKFGWRSVQIRPVPHHLARSLGASGFETRAHDAESIYSTLLRISGGEGGIRTPGTLASTSDFESGAFNRALPPLRDITHLSSMS